MKLEQLELERLRREVAKLKAERDILKKGRSLLREGSISGSLSSRGTVRSGRWYGFATRWMSLVPGAMLG